MSDPRDAKLIRSYNWRRHSFAPISNQGQQINSGGGLHTEDNFGMLMNLLAMICSMCALLMKIKWAAWGAIMSSLIGYAVAKTSDDSRQILSSILLGVSSVVMTYMQNPDPLGQSIFP